MATGETAIEVVAVFNGAVLAVRHLVGPTDEFTIGPDAAATFTVPGRLVPTARFTLVRWKNDRHELCFTAKMSGHLDGEGDPYRRVTRPLGALIGDGRARAIEDGTYFCEISTGTFRIQLGQLIFVVSRVAAPQRLPPVRLRIDCLDPYTIGVTGVVAAFLALILAIPPRPELLALAEASRWRISFTNDKVPEELKRRYAGPGGRGALERDWQGMMGRPSVHKRTGLYALEGPRANPDPHLVRLRAEAEARRSGVLGVLAAQEGSHLASLFGRESALGNEAENVMGGLVGPEIGDAYGQGGLGLVGEGRGGGGTGEGTIGLGTIGSFGKGAGGGVSFGSGSGYASGVGGIGGRRAHAPDVVAATAEVRGTLDKEIIRRVIRRHLNEVKFCYERELLKKADLYGRIAITFTISGTGQVVASMVASSTLNNPMVEHCIADAVRRWEFPKPLGGGTVMVSYPFVLKAAED
jgi:hypothetical protein